MLRHAMILAAGKGTRLKPLTDNKPKALVEIQGVTLLEIIITRLLRQGITSFTVNVHHYSGMIIDFLEKKKMFGVPVSISDETGFLLDSGGGIQQAKLFFPKGEDVLIHNVDVISNIDINQFHQYHCRQKAVATLAVRHRETNRHVLFDEDGRLCGWKNDFNGDQILSRNITSTPVSLAFSGIYILAPGFMNLMDRGGAYPVWDEILKQSADAVVSGYIHDQDYWVDVGKNQHLQEAEKYLMKVGFNY